MPETSPLRVLIADDEPLARAKICEMLAGQDTVQIVGECATGRQTLTAVRELKPDLLFLDIQMPEMTGLEALEQLQGEATPHVVLVTAYDRYAVRAFEYAALDYLLKPFDRGRFLKALERARLQVARQQQNLSIQAVVRFVEDLRRGPAHVDRFAVKGKDGSVLLLRDQEIDWIESEGNYVRLHARKQRFLLRQTIGALEQELDPKRFIRVHRSTIVNLDRIKELQPLFRGDFTIVLEDGTRLTLSRGHRKHLQDRLGRKL